MVENLTAATNFAQFTFFEKGSLSPKQQLPLCEIFCESNDKLRLFEENLISRTFELKKCHTIFEHDFLLKQNLGKLATL